MKIHLDNYYVQAAIGYSRDAKAPLLLVGTNVETNNLEYFEVAKLEFHSAKTYNYLGEFETKNDQGGVRTHFSELMIVIFLEDPHPDYLKYICRSVIETWNPDEPLRLGDLK